MIACKEYDSLEEAVERIVKVSSTIEADEKLSEAYELRYKEFKELYPALKDCFSGMID